MQSKQTPDAADDVDTLVHAAGEGNAEAMNQVWVLLYQQLHEIASRQMSRESSGHLMQTTAIVHEAWFRLSKTQRSDWRDQTGFMAAAANVMRRVLIDHARFESAKRRGGIKRQTELTDTCLKWDGEPVETLAVHEALERLHAISPEQAKTLEMMIFGGMSGVQVASIQGVSESTVDRRIRSAKAWLRRELA
ncbi:MAG: ECF-type sigma factor [Planctomycetota bacterium]